MYYKELSSIYILSILVSNNNSLKNNLKNTLGIDVGI